MKPYRRLGFDGGSDGAGAADAGEVVAGDQPFSLAQQLDSAGVEDDPAKLIGFIQWQVLRAATPLREIAQHTASGPIPVAAAHAADGLQMLLGVIAASQAAIAAGDVAALACQAPALREARATLEDAIANTDLLLDLLASVGL